MALNCFRKIVHSLALRAWIASNLAVLLIVSGVWSANGSSAEGCPQDEPPGIDYAIDLSDALNHYISVEMTARPTGPQTQLMMATWTPGSYLVREYARHVDRIEVVDDEGKLLPFEKISKNRWSIETAETERTFVVRYRVWCDELSVRANFATRGFAVLNGAATFLTVPEQREAPHRVCLELPKGWRRSATSLRHAGDDANHYEAANFDELVDSPIVAGNVELFPFQAGGVEHFLVNVNDIGNQDGERAARDLAKVVAAHHQVWGTIPYDRYYFINVIGDGGGGLEHDNSCLMITSRYAMRSDAAYQRWLGLASHEFFHTWNVRRLRPAGLVKYDYESELYTPSLWVAEGVTSYYEDLLLVRAGLLDEETFLKGMGSVIADLQGSPGRLVQSLRDSSHDAWIKYYRPAANRDETQISYYTKGAVAALLLDVQIRSATGGEKSLDDALRVLYERHSGDTGFTPADFRDICSEVAGTDLGDWFTRAIDSTEELDYQPLADWFGLVVGDVVPAGTKPAGPDAAIEDSLVRWIGIGESGSPATRAGLSDSDELLAINEVRLSNGLDARLQEFEVGDPIEVLISRDDQIMEVLLTVGGRPRQPDWGLQASEESSDEQTARRDAWLGSGAGEPSNERAVGK